MDFDLKDFIAWQGEYGDPTKWDAVTRMEAFSWLGSMRSEIERLRSEQQEERQK